MSKHNRRFTDSILIDGIISATMAIGATVISAIGFIYILGLIAEFLKG